MNAKHRAVMKQAVDALQFARNQIVHLADAANLRPLVRDISSAIEALRAALAEPESDEWIPCPWCGETKPRAALAEPEQEPVAPARRPLTDEEIEEIAATNLGDYEDGTWHLLFARAIERKITGGNDE